MKQKNSKEETKSTFDRLMQNPEWKKSFEKGYELFLISEKKIETKKENIRQQTTSFNIVIKA